MKQVIQLFNLYKEHGGEEVIVNEIEKLLNASGEVNVTGFYSDSAEWNNFWKPSVYSKLSKTLYNKEVEKRLAGLIAKLNAQAIIAHNVYPILSRSVYSVAHKMDIPMIQYLHNYRPFSVSGSLWANGRIIEDGLDGNMWPEIKARAWQKSFIKTYILSHVLKKFITSEGFQHISKWVACSDFVKEKFIRAGIPDEKIITLRHGWKMLESLPVFKDDGYYLLLARLVPEKGIAVAIDAWRILEKKLGSKCPVLVIAGSGSEESLVRKEVSLLRSLRYVDYVTKEHKHKLLSDCRATLAPSTWYEPLGLVTYESYDYSKPILAARSGGLSETVVHEVTGLLHEPGNAADLADNVLLIESKSSHEIKEMGTKGREWLMRETNYDEWGRKLLDIIKNV